MCPGSIWRSSEAFRVLKPGSRFLCLEFSTVDVPGLDRLYEMFSFKVIPQLGQAVTGDANSYRYLVEFDPEISKTEHVRRDDPRRRILARRSSDAHRRHRRVAFGLAFVISALTHIARLARAGFVFAREGVFGVVDPSLVPPPGQLALRLARLIERPGAKSGPRLSRALTRLGPAYLKLGQFLATRPDVVGVMMARDLESLQDRLPPFSQEEAEAVIAASLERPVAQAFASFGPSVAAASIAQVHRGETEQDGIRKAVAVKVLRPNVAARFRRDLADFFFVANNAEKYSAEARRLRLIEVINTMSRSVAMEMDLRLEAAAMSEMAENTRDDPDFRVPTVDWDRTTHNVLTMEWIDGIALSDHAGLEAAQVDLPDLGRKVIQSFLRHALRDGFFHADMHPGNLFLDDAGRLVAVDFGIMGRLGMKERRFLAEILLGFITRDYRRVAEVHFEAGYVPSASLGGEFRASHPRHRRADPQPHRRRNLDGETADACCWRSPGCSTCSTRPELILLQKTMVVVEGVARSFDPKLDIWKVADPVVREWIERNLGPVGRIQGAMSGAGELGRVLSGLPSIAIARGGGAGAVGDHDPRRPDAVAGDGRGDGPGRRPQEPLAHRGAVDHCPHLHRHPVRGPATLIPGLHCNHL